MTRWVVIVVALIAGFLLLSYDQRTDDTGVEALAIGLPIAAWSVMHGNGPGSRRYSSRARVPSWVM